jgi:hypothetical protein
MIHRTPQTLRHHVLRNNYLRLLTGIIGKSKRNIRLSVRRDIVDWRKHVAIVVIWVNCNLTNLTFRGTCIVTYSYNKSQRDALFLNFILVKSSLLFRNSILVKSSLLFRNFILVKSSLLFRNFILVNSSLLFLNFILVKSSLLLLNFILVKSSLLLLNFILVKSSLLFLNFILVKSSLTK